VKNIKQLLAPVYCYWLRHFYWRNFVLLRFNVFARWFGAACILRLLGARIESATRIAADIRIQNAQHGKCTNLQIGKMVYIGPRCLFDLASKITIEDEVALSADTRIITHADVGQRPLSARFPREEGPVVIGRGAWLGVNTTVLHGVRIGRFAVTGANSLVNKDLPDNSVSYGVPARVIKQFDRCPDDS